MQVSKCLIQRSLANRRLINVIRSPSLCRVYVGTASQWLEQLQVQVPVGTSPMSTSIIHHADSLHHQHWPGSYEGMDRDSGSAGAPPTPATPPTPSAVTSSILLREQELAVPSTFSVAPQTSVPVHQLVAVFSSLLGSPKLPKDARASSMAVKWRLLQLLLLQHAGDREAFADSLQQLLEVMLSDTVRRLGKVLANPKVPEINKQLAEERCQLLWTTCRDSICTWVEDACSSANFATLQPAMCDLSSALTASVLTAGETGKDTRSSSAGRLMEAAAVQAVQDALPEGWTLLTSLHLLGVDGVSLTTTTQRGCKFEADILVLNEQGVAVAIVEVKLAAANPLMALVNDATGLLRLVDRTAGRLLTAATKNEATAAAAAKAAAAYAAAADSSSAAQLGMGLSPDDDGELQSRLAGMTARPPFAVGPSWHILHVPVHQDLLPIYVMGSPITDSAMSRGLNSLVSSGSLKMLGRSAAALAAALRGQQQQQQWPLGERGSSTPAGSSHVPAGCSERAAVAFSSSSSMSDGLLADGESELCLSRSNSSSWGAALTSSSLESMLSLTSFPGSGLGSEGSSLQSPTATFGLQQDAPGKQLVRAESVSSVRARIRTRLQLDPQQQEHLAAGIWSKLMTLSERCKIYSLVQSEE